MLIRRFLCVVACLAVCASSSIGFWHGAQPSGQGGGPNLMLANAMSPPYGASISQRSIDRPAASTADYYHQDGVYYSQPFDLNAMGTWGQTIAAAKGYRYFWLIGPDHPGCIGGYPLVCWGNDGSYVYRGFSNDPAVLPDPSTMVPLIPPGVTDATMPGLGGTGQAYSFMVPWAMYNADDASNHLYVYTECIDNSGDSHNTAIQMCLWVGNDLDTPLTAVGVSHQADCTSGCTFTSFQTVYKTGASTCTSWGGGGRWKSTDNCQTFTIDSSNIVASTGTCSPVALADCITYQTVIGAQQFTVGGTIYTIGRADARSGGNGMYVALTPIDSGGNLITTGTPPIVAISSKYNGDFPGPTYLGTANAYYEDGLAYTWAEHGVFITVGTTCANGALYAGSPCPAGGGGLQQEYLDLYIYVADSTAAAAAAPAGVQVSAASGSATLTWYEPPGLPTHGYNIYRSTAAGTKGSLVGSTSGASFQDTPTASSSCTLYYYRVYKVDAVSTERGFRTVSTFVSSSSAFVNKHITRACLAGADFTTIDRTWLDAIDSALDSNNMKVNLLFGTDPAFGVIKSGSNISRIMDLGTTRLPRGGDFTPTSPSSTTYGATACNGTVPGWVNATASAFGYFGESAGKRLNQIRLKPGFSFFAAYQPGGNLGDTTLLALGENGDGMSLQHIHGATQKARWNVAQLTAPPGWTLTDDKNVTGATTHITAGTYDGTTAKVFAEGVAGSGAGPALDASPQTGQVDHPSNVYLLNSGSSRTVVASGGSTGKSYSFFSNEAFYTGCALWVFDAGMSPSQIAALTTLYRNRIGP